MTRFVGILLVLTLAACGGTIPPGVKSVGIVSNFAGNVLYHNNNIFNDHTVEDVADWKLDDFAAAEFSKSLVADGYTTFTPPANRSLVACRDFTYIGTPGDRLRKLVGSALPNADIWIYIEWNLAQGCNTPLFVGVNSSVWKSTSEAVVSINAAAYLIDGHTFKWISISPLAVKMTLPAKDFPSHWKQLDPAHREELRTAFEQLITAGTPLTLVWTKLPGTSAP